MNLPFFNDDQRESDPNRANGIFVHGEKGEERVQDTVLIGIDATFHGHPENTFRIVGNAIFTGLD